MLSRLCGCMVESVMDLIRTYNDLVRLQTFEERFRYLRLDGSVASRTFGGDRYLNQAFYNSKEWRRVRNLVIVRDQGFDLGIFDRPIGEIIVVHHMNPISVDDICHSTDFLLNPEYLISTGVLTHDAIHYGDESLLPKAPVERSLYDTCPWKQ